MTDKHLPNKEPKKALYIPQTRSPRLAELLARLWSAMKRAIDNLQWCRFTRRIDVHPAFVERAFSH
jgi:hypothetical protein